MLHKASLHPLSPPQSSPLTLPLLDRLHRTLETFVSVNEKESRRSIPAEDRNGRIVRIIKIRWNAMKTHILPPPPVPYFPFVRNKFENPPPRPLFNNNPRERNPRFDFEARIPPDPICHPNTPSVTQ